MKRLHQPWKVWLAGLLILCSVWPVLLQAREAFTSGLLWEIRAAGQPPSYLFGTIHLEDPRVTRLPTAVERAFAAADRLVLEIELNAENLLAMSLGMLLHDGSSLHDLLGEELYRRTAQAMAAHGVPEPVLERMKPWAAATLLMMPKAETGRFLDQGLYQRALAEDKAVTGLETAAEQLAVFDGMPLAQQLELLTETLAQLDEIQAMLEDLIGAYLARDLARLQALNAAALAGSSAPLVERFNRDLLAERNHRMVRRLPALLEQGNAFIAVGALHLPGEEGLLQLLQQHGYGVRVLY